MIKILLWNSEAIILIMWLYKNCNIIFRIFFNISIFLPLSWDNGDTEKMSPWDMELIPNNGKCMLGFSSLYYGTNFLSKKTDMLT